MPNSTHIRSANIPLDPSDVSHQPANAFLHTSVADPKKFTPESGEGADDAAVEDSLETAHRYKIVADLTSDFAYCFLVQPDGTLIVEWMTDAVTRVLGYAIEDVNAQGWQSFLYDEDALIVMYHYQQLITGQADVAEFRVYGENRQVVWMRNYARPVWDADHERVVRIYGAAQDITERKQAEQQIAALNARLRLAMKESFHRIKNNLQVIASLISMQAMEHHGTLPADNVAQLEARLHALAAVHNLLTQGVREDGQAPFVSTRPLLEKLCALMQQVAGQHHLQYRVTDVVLPQRQATALALVVNELVQNAFKAGTCEVTVTFEVMDNEAEAVLEVQDDGGGLPTSFDPVQDAHIGLQLVQDLTETDLNGQTGFQNRPEGGARVRITFPLPKA